MVITFEGMVRPKGQDYAGPVEKGVDCATFGNIDMRGQRPVSLPSRLDQYPLSFDLPCPCAFPHSDRPY
jgi:hypothetical protein